jgi:hypothetical protein
MYNTTPKFKENIYAPVRRTAGRVTFDISDVTASGDVNNITVTSESPLSVKAQLINKARSSTYKTATWEKDRFSLDGTFSFPDDTLSNNGELGWSSAVMSDLAGSFEITNLVASTLFVGWTNFGGATSTLTQNQPDPIGGANATRIQSSGGTGVIKYYTGVGTGANGTTNTTSVWVKNNSLTDVEVHSNAGFASKIIKKTDGWVKFSYQTVSNGSSIRQIQFRTLLVSENLDIVAFQPQITETSYEQPFTVGTSVKPSMTFDFSSNHSSAGLTVTFDSVNGEYATDFSMTAYDAAGAVITTTNVTGNTDIIAVPIGQLYNYRKVSVTIKKWSKPFRRARVMEVDFGFVKQYGDDQLISMSLVEEMDLLTGRLPSPEFKFTIDNSGKLFNILNPTGFYKYLQQKQQVIGEIGLDTGGGNIEYIPIANFLLQEWKSDQGSLTATFTARSNLDLMASFDVENLTGVTQSLYDLTVWMFSYCGITNYYIDPALQAITTNTLIEKTNFRNLLQMVAIAGCANIYVSRDNKITLKCKKTRKVRYIRDWIAGSNANPGNHWVEIQSLNGATNVAVGKPTTFSSLLTQGVPALVTDGNTDTANYAGFGSGVYAPGWCMVDLGAVYDIDTVKVWHYYADGRIYNATKTEVSTDGITWKTVYDSAVSGTYQETAAGRTYYMETTTGDMTPVDTADFDNMYTEPQIELDKAIKRVEVSYFTSLTASVSVGVNHPINTVGDTMKLEQNTLITSAARAQAVAEWLMSQVQYRATFSTRWRGNPAVELNDVLSFENTYGANMSAYVTRNEIEYAGYLQARTQAKGVVN